MRVFLRFATRGLALLAGGVIFWGMMLLLGILLSPIAESLKP